jgi:hypothetical protein
MTRNATSNHSDTGDIVMATFTLSQMLDRANADHTAEPAFASMYDFDTWKTVGPPVGTVYGYPPRGDEQTLIAGAPARTDVGAQIYNQAINTVMVAKFTQGGEKLDDVLKWVENELEGTLRA